jgi:hypothetical protein
MRNITSHFCSAPIWVCVSQVPIRSTKRYNYVSIFSPSGFCCLALCFLRCKRAADINLSDSRIAGTETGEFPEIEMESEMTKYINRFADTMISQAMMENQNLGGKSLYL